jgi:putative heme-binding domain-containing protein
MDLASLSAQQMLCALRILELSIARGGSDVEKSYGAIDIQLSPRFPMDDDRINRELVRILCRVGSSRSLEKILQHMRADVGERPQLGGDYFVRNPKYGQAIRDIVLSAPLINRMHDAQMLLWLEHGWTLEQRTEYFQLIADASSISRGGYWYREFWDRIREAALESLSDDERERVESIGAGDVSSPEETLPTPEGPGNAWTLAEILDAVSDQFHHRSFANGQKMFAAAKCVSCHRFHGEGATVGPDLSSIGQRFTLRDILDSTVNPNKAISDQYRVHMIVTDDGRTHFGGVIARDNRRVTIAPNLNRPSQTTEIALASIEDEKPLELSTMPTDLLNPLNMDEIVDLLAYLVSGGDASHPVFEHP